MQTVLFYYTLSILLLSIMAAALCLAAFIVSRNRGMLFAFTAFLSYFFAICEQRRVISRILYFVVPQACLCIGIVCELNKACGAYFARRVTSRLRNV